MNFLQYLDFHFFLITMMGAITVRELLIIFLPEKIAGPRGWLIRTREDT